MDWPLVIGALAGFVPAIAILWVSYGPFEGHFRDNMLFLFFMGGVFVGMGVQLLENLLRAPAGDPFYTLAMVVVGYPILEGLVKLAILNRRSFRGARPTIYYGGGLGLGLGTMAILVKSQAPFEVPLRTFTLPGGCTTGLEYAPYLLAVAVAYLLGQFATGIILGDGVRDRDPWPSLGLAVLALVPLQFLLFQFTAGLSFCLGAEGLVWLVLALAYAVGLAWWAHAKLLPRGLPPEAQRKRRRLFRQRQRESGDGP